jgi:hypothetical protein
MPLPPLWGFLAYSRVKFTFAITYVYMYYVYVRIYLRYIYIYGRYIL